MNFGTSTKAVALAASLLATYGCTTRPSETDATAATDSTGGVNSTSDASTTGVSADADASSTGVGSSTLDPGTTSATTTGATDGGATAATDSASTTSGGVGACGIVDGDHGDCQRPLGWAFDGARCQQRSGCDCAADCDMFHATAYECAEACADAGECNEDELVGRGIADDLVLGGGCDSISTCGPEGDAFVVLLEQYFPGPITCEPSVPCGGQRCYLTDGGVDIDDALWVTLCAASLDPALGPIECHIIGP